MAWKSVGKILVSAEARKVVTAIERGYGNLNRERGRGLQARLVRRALVHLIGLVKKHVEDCQGNSPEEFFRIHKSKLAWIKNLKEDTIARLYHATIGARVHLRSLVQDIPVVGRNAAPARAWQTSELTKEIDRLTDTIYERYTRGFPEVVWDWAAKDAEDTDWELSDDDEDEDEDEDEDQIDGDGDVEMDEDEEEMDEDEEEIDDAMQTMALV
ncbi:hypothetical protein BJ166DRAFT_491590 [Pestalotiopsis sp. NC0098]|nr:hypothetical protein BJ166DRAFT_491590 [Pestalotiopsis sp. NC0098]